MPAMSGRPLDGLSGCTVELLVSCTGLADLDEFTKTDPMCVLFFKQFGQWKEFGRTEAIANTLDPKFAETFVMDYEPTVQQLLMFSIYDVDSRSTNLMHHDYVGSAEVTLESLLDEDKPICTTCKTIRVPGDPRARGMVSITAEVKRPSKNRVGLHIGVQKLVKTGKIIMSKPDAYLEISRSIDTLSYHPVFRTETVHKSQNPRWRPFEIPVQKLCNGDWDRHIEIACWHHSGIGDYKLLGRKITTLRELSILERKGQYAEMELVHKKTKNTKQSVKKTYCGTLRFFKIDVDNQYSLLDFVRGGLDIKVKIAIDFTSSNGLLSDNLCLHTTSTERPNQYVEVMETLGAMLSQYDSQQQLAVFGFGAKLAGTDYTTHCFPVTLDWSNVYVSGIKGAIECYRNVLGQLTFAGPTKLQPVIAMAESLAVTEPTQETQAYHVLLVITDGVVNDLDDAIERLISISHLPLSVIFIGVGPADFAIMEMFSFHNNRVLTIEELGVMATRCNTHFVGLSPGGASGRGNELWARDAFAVLSTQIQKYMKNKGIIPNRPIPSRNISQSASSDVMCSEEYSEEESRVLNRVSSNLSEKGVRFTESTGPSCPTCGSVLEPGTFLYSEMSKIS